MPSEKHLENAKKIAQSWNEFEQCFLVDKKSYIIPYENKIYTKERVEKVLELFRDIKTEEKLTFKEKLAIQFGDDSGATVEDKLIFLHAEWIYFLITMGSKKATKIEKLSRWDIGQVRNDIALDGIANTGTFFTIHKYRCVKFILELLKDTYDKPEGQHKAHIEQYCNDKKNQTGLYPICSAILLYC